MDRKSFENVSSIFKGKKILAPLVGGSDLSFRLLARKYGADVTFTEMNIAEYYNINHNSNPLKKKLKSYQYEFDTTLDRPLILQLAGNTSKPIISLIESQFEIFEKSINGLDINCGCPQGFAMRKGIGAALLSNPENLVSLVKEVNEAVPYPISVKMRLSEDGFQATVGLIEKLHSIGVKAVTVHGRYWYQKNVNRGLNNWDAIRYIKERLPSNLILIGNGDVRQYSDFERYRVLSKVDAVMCGYGALKNPSIFQSQFHSYERILTDYIEIAKRHRNKLIDIKRHIMWMIGELISGRHEIAAQLFQANELSEISEILKKLELDVQVPVDCVDRIEYPIKIEK